MSIVKKDGGEEKIAEPECAPYLAPGSMVRDAKNLRGSADSLRKWGKLPAIRLGSDPQR